MHKILALTYEKLILKPSYQSPDKKPFLNNYLYYSIDFKNDHAFSITTTMMQYRVQHFTQIRNAEPLHTHTRVNNISRYIFPRCLYVWFYNQ